jgi:hypothetical protein
MSTSSRPMAAGGKMLMSTEPSERVEPPTRRPLKSTRVRGPVTTEFRLRRLIVAVPLPAPNRLFSPITAPDEGMVLISWVMVGAPRCSSSLAPITSTGRAASSGVPAMNEPVTMTSSSSLS